jgi:hypothetical protein
MKAREKLIRWAFFFCLASVYLIPFPYLQRMNNPNENTRVFMTMALVEHHTFAIDSMIQRFGWTNDMAKVPDLKEKRGFHLASVKGPAVSLLGVPVYAGYKLIQGTLFHKRIPDSSASVIEKQAWLRGSVMWLQLFTVKLPCWLMLLWFERRLRRISSDTVLRFSAVAALGLGTNYLAYSLMFVSHAWIAAITFFAFDWVSAERELCRNDPEHLATWKALVGGLLVGSITLLEYQSLFMSVIIAVYGLALFRKPRLALGYIGGGLICVAIMMWTQWASFGNAFTPGHKLLENQAFRALSEKGFFGLVAPNPEAAKALLFDGGFGLFGTSPYLWLAPLGLLFAFRFPGRNGELKQQRRWEYGIALAAIGLLILSVSASIIWRGGWTIGPRYFGPLPALVAYLALAGTDSFCKRFPSVRPIAQATALGLAMASFASIGAVSLVINTLPEAIVRPAAQVFVPLVKVRLLPHHLLEYVGVSNSWPWFIALIAASACFFSIHAWVVSNATTRISTKVWQTGLALGISVLASWSAYHIPAGEKDAGPQVRAMFYGMWEPANQNRLYKAYQRTAQDPCAWYEVAHWEQLMGRVPQARFAERKAQLCSR